jgi:pimeloyl-ACP methyl ester carboxylesterase
VTYDLDDVLAGLLSCRRLLNAAESTTRVSLGPPETSPTSALRDALREACSVFGIDGIEPGTQPGSPLGVEGVVARRLGGPPGLQLASKALADGRVDVRAAIDRVHASDARRSFDIERIRRDDGLPLHLYSRGREEGSAVLVVLPFGVPVEVLFGLADHVSPHHRFVAFEGIDLVGDPEEFGRFSHGIHSVTRSILAVLDHCRLANAHLIGICGSALSAIRFANLHPERVRSLILGNGFYPGTPLRSTGFPQMMRQIAGNRAKADVMCRFMCAQDLNRIEPELPHWTMVPYVNRNLLYMHAGALDGLAGETPDPRVFEDWLADVACPVLVLVAEQDTMVNPANSHAVARQLKGSETYVEKDGSHLTFLSHPSSNAVSSVLRFLDRCDA